MQEEAEVILRGQQGKRSCLTYLFEKQDKRKREGEWTSGAKQTAPKTTARVKAMIMTFYKETGEKMSFFFLLAVRKVLLGLGYTMAA